MNIQFGSDGFRGVIGHTFTRDAVARITLGAIAFLRETNVNWQGQTVPVGYDTRFHSKLMASYAARILKRAGLVPLLAHRPCPSPYLAYAVRHFASPLGLQVTASHNPPSYCGIKLKGEHGGSLFPAHADLVEHLANAVDPSEIAGLPLLPADDSIKEFNVDKSYTAAIWQAAGWGGDPQCVLLVDYMHGAAAGVYHDILISGFELDTVLRANADPLFGGGKPEPAPAALTELRQLVGADIRRPVGLAFDGDGDRLGVIDEAGEFMAPHEIFCLLLAHLAGEKKREGVVVTTVSFSGLIERVARAHGLVVMDVPVGFKHVSYEMVDNNAIMGGEESGGTGFGHYLPERDALLMALLLLNARHCAGATLHDMVAQLYRTYGKPVFARRDVQLNSLLSRNELTARIRGLADIDALDGDPVTGLNHRDGMKLKTADGWVLVRASGTEPLLRVYAEAAGAEQVEAYTEAVLKALEL